MLVTQGLCQLGFDHQRVQQQQQLGPSKHVLNCILNVEQLGPAAPHRLPAPCTHCTGAPLGMPRLQGSLQRRKYIVSVLVCSALACSVVATAVVYAVAAHLTGPAPPASGTDSLQTARLPENMKFIAAKRRLPPC
jgi:hypothetical protein